MRKEEKVLMEVYRTVYKELGIDLDKLIEDGTTREDMWFMQCQLPTTKVVGLSKTNQ